MTCKICGQGNCMFSFHSLEEQSLYEEVKEETRESCINLLLDAKAEIVSLNETILELEEQLESAYEELAGESI